MVIVNLVTGHEDAERVTVAFLVAVAALEKGQAGDDVPHQGGGPYRPAGYADAIETAGAPPVSRLFAQFAEKGGELLVCPICFEARKLDADALVDNARLGGATPLWELIGDEPATVLSY
jgi:predicted peroxiredoxin